MSSFEQLVEDNQKHKKIYKFTPKTKSENGPLEIFSDNQLKKEIQQLLGNEEVRKLIDQLIQRMEHYQLDKNNKVF